MAINNDQSKRYVTIDVLNEQIKMRTSLEEDVAANAVALVEEKVKEVLLRESEINPLRAAVLVALNIAAEHSALKKEHKVFTEHVQEKTKNILGTIDREFFSS